MQVCRKNNLKAGRWSAAVLPRFGMNTVCLTWDGRPVLRRPAEIEQLEQSPCVYGIPVLMPPNRPAGGRFSFDGQEYQLPVNEPALGNHIHGQVHSRAFTLTGAQPDSVSAFYENRGETFPFPYRLEVYFRLSEAGYAQTFAFTNTGNRDMPLCFGLHTVFFRPQWIAVPIGKRWATDEKLIPTGALEELTPQWEEYRTGLNPEGKTVRGFYTAGGHEAVIDDFRYRVSDNFDQWVLWNGDGSEFCAIEPMCGAVNALNSGTGLLRLAPGQTVRFETLLSHCEG